MAILVTRPQPDAEASAAALRQRGFDVLVAPVLRFEPLPLHDDNEARYAAVIVTSANALRAIAPHLANHHWLQLPLYAVGEHTAAAARDIGFGRVIASKGDAGALREVLIQSVKARQLRQPATLLYLAGADLARDLRGELEEAGFTVITHTTYRMIPVPHLPKEVCEAFVANRIEAVLHYSRRSAGAFVDASRAAGMEISALAPPQCCISANVASILLDAGATSIVTAAEPSENVLFEAMTRALRPRLA
jgi:uroporphyrinogen-III synthase